MARITTHASSQVLVDLALTRIAEQVERWPERRFFLIVPDASKADIERRYLERFQERGLLMAEVLSFKRLAFRLFAEAGGLGVRRLSPSGRAILISNILLTNTLAFERLSNFRSRPGYAIQLAALLDEFARHAVDATALQNAADDAPDRRASMRFRDLATLCQLVETRRREDGFVDSSEDARRLVALLESNVDQRLDFLRKTTVLVVDQGEQMPFSASDLAILKALDTRVDRLEIFLSDGDDASYAHARRALSQVRALMPVSVEAYEHPVPPPTPLRYLRLTSSVADEAAFVAGEIRRLLQDGVKRREIAIGMCDEASSDQLAETLRKFEVPTFMDEASDISWTPFTRLMVALLNISSHIDSLSEVMRLLESPLLGFSRETTDRFENVCLAEGWTRLPRMLDAPLPDVRRDRAAVVLCRRFLTIVADLGRRLREQVTGAAKVDVIETFWAAWPALFDRIEEDIKTDGAANRVQQATAHARSVNEWQNVLAECRTILADARISQAHFVDMVTAAILGMELRQIPAGIDRVRVGPLRQIVHYPTRFLFVTGVSADTYPLSSHGASFLTIEERQRLASMVSGFPDGREDDRLAALALDRLVRHNASDALYFTTPDAETNLPPTLERDGQLRRSTQQPDEPGIHWNHPDEAVDRLRRLPPEARSSAAVQRFQAALKRRGVKADPPPQSDVHTATEHLQLDTTLLANVLMQRPVTSISPIQVYNSCPYRFYTTSLLRLMERLSATPDAAIQGIFMHDVLFHALAGLRERLQGVPPAARHAIIRQWRLALQDGGQRRLEADLMAQGGARVLGRRGNDMRVTRRLSPAIAENLDRIAAHYTAHGALPVALEYRFSPQNGNALTIDVDGTPIAFAGVIDRIDRYPDGTDVLVDYKRGKHPFDRKAFDAGLDIQLPFYQNAWTRLDPAHRIKGFYYQTLQPYGEEMGYAPPVLDQGQHDSVVAKRLITDPTMAEQAVTMAVDTLRQIQSGEMMALPCSTNATNDPCRYCAHRVACRLDPYGNRRKGGA